MHNLLHCNKLCRQPKAKPAFLEVKKIMNLQTVVDDVKGRVETLTSQSQKVAQISLDTLKQVNEIVVDKFQALLKTETAAAKDLFSAAKTGLDKARADGLKAVASAPISYLPERSKLVTVYNDTVTLITDTGEKVYQTFKTGFTTIQGELKGETVEVEGEAAPVKKAKTTKKAGTKKAAAKAE